MLSGAAKKAYNRWHYQQRRAGLPTRKNEIEDDEIEYCSFCGKVPDQVRVLIATRDTAPRAAFICDQCVEAAAAVVAERKWRW
jgi:hypothetical protein